MIRAQQTQIAQFGEKMPNQNAILKMTATGSCGCNEDEGIQSPPIQVKEHVKDVVRGSYRGRHGEALSV